MYIAQQNTNPVIKETLVRGESGSPGPQQQNKPAHPHTHARTHGPVRRVRTDRLLLQRRIRRWIHAGWFCPVRVRRRRGRGRGCSLSLSLFLFGYHGNKLKEKVTGTHVMSAQTVNRVYRNVSTKKCNQNL
ncbi:hypothetical protein AMECASPLE_038370 [Ameca splendens]|uniref:Uncharacterized protein n=1 Tax=Ameca splendens TaxID=208324 RepID=A0ABV1AFQ1_9TELE